MSRQPVKESPKESGRPTTPTYEGSWWDTPGLDVPAGSVVEISCVGTLSLFWETAHTTPTLPLTGMLKAVRAAPIPGLAKIALHTRFCAMSKLPIGPVSVVLSPSRVTHRLQLNLPARAVVFRSPSNLLRMEQCRGPIIRNLTSPGVECLVDLRLTVLLHSSTESIPRPYLPATAEVLTQLAVTTNPDEVVF